jgi:hypothetical protein
MKRMFGESKRISVHDIRTSFYAVLQWSTLDQTACSENPGKGAGNNLDMFHELIKTRSKMSTAEVRETISNGFTTKSKTNSSGVISRGAGNYLKVKTNHGYSKTMYSAVVLSYVFFGQPDPFKRSVCDTRKPR